MKENDLKNLLDVMPEGFNYHYIIIIIFPFIC